MKKIALVYVILALIVALVTTFMQVQPALFFIELLTDSDNMFPVKLAALVTTLALLLPLIPVVLIFRLAQKNKGDFMPDNLAGRTGLVVRRERQLYDALYPHKVMVNGEAASTVSNGKSTFVELTPGTYKVFIKTGTLQSPVLDVDVQPHKVCELVTRNENETFKAKILLESIGTK